MRFGISNKVYFAGHMSGKDVQKMYKAADISVFPSTYEPFGIVALEGMLAERPIVVSDAGGLGEIVEHRVTGMKSYCGNPNSIADSVTALLYDHQLAANVSKKARQKVKEQFNWEKIAQDTHFTYEKAICQALVIPVPTVDVEEYTYEELLAIPSSRGTGALGSSGK